MVAGLAHGAGAGMTHPFLEKLAGELASAGVATFRYQFPYMEERRRVPDRPPVATAAVAAAVRAAAEAAPGLTLIAGGKSFGGRMSSQAASQGLLEGVRGLVFFGFPLHPPNKPGRSAPNILARCRCRCSFCRDAGYLADLNLLQPICADLGSQATLHIIESADHSFHVLKSAGKSDPEVLRELAQATASWLTI